MNIEKKNLKVFGYGLAVILGIVSLKVWKDHGWHVIHIVLFFGIGVLTSLASFWYRSLRPFYSRWMRVAHFIGSIITGLVLSVLFYAVFGTVGILLRLCRRDLLDRGIDPAARSYWKKREAAHFDKNHYLRQF